MEKILIIDTNVIVDFANHKPGAIDLDAIIAATAVVIGGEIVTRDAHFLTCTYPLLRIYADLCAMP